MIAAVMFSDLVVAFALACPFIAVAILLSGDVAQWLRGESGDEVGADRVSQSGDVTSYGLTAEAATGADDDWFGDAA